MGSSIGMYKYRDAFYTGTATQPDTLTIFVKGQNKKEVHLFHAEPFANISGKALPLIGSATGVARVVNSVKVIFKNMSNRKAAPSKGTWNAFKNLFRGIVEFIPLSGVFLIIFDSARQNIFYRSRITKGIKDKKNIVGIALDGKVICTIDLVYLKKFKKDHHIAPHQSSLAIFKELCLEGLKKQDRQVCSTTVARFCLNLKEFLEMPAGEDSTP